MADATNLADGIAKYFKGDAIKALAANRVWRVEETERGSELICDFDFGPMAPDQNAWILALEDNSLFHKVLKAPKAPDGVLLVATPDIPGWLVITAECKRTLTRDAWEKARVQVASALRQVQMVNALLRAPLSEVVLWICFEHDRVFDPGTTDPITLETILNTHPDDLDGDVVTWDYINGLVRLENHRIPVTFVQVGIPAGATVPTGQFTVNGLVSCTPCKRQGRLVL